MVNLLQQMQQKKCMLCLYRLIASLLFSEGAFSISPDSAEFPAFSNSQLLAHFQPFSRFSTFFNFEKIISYAQTDAHYVYVVISIYFWEL